MTSVRDGTVRVNRKERSDKCNPETIQKVTQFYLDEKNSKILPGKKDWVSVKTSNGRVKMRKQFLLSTIGEAHLQFVEENGNIISKDMFRKLRPPNVVLVGSAGTHQICTCVLCENPKLMLTTSNIGHDSIMSLIPDSEKLEPGAFVQQLVCENPTEECYLSECEQCKEKFESLKNKMKDTLKNEDIEMITYTQWSFDQGSQYENIRLNVDDYSHEFAEAMEDFKTHLFIHKQQSTHLYKMRKNPPVGTMIIWMDYAENYACVSQDEVQQAYFRKCQVSMLTVYVFMTVNGVVKEQSYVVLTDDTRNAKTGSVWASYEKLQMKLNEQFPARTHTVIVTDGCAGK